MKLHYAIRGSCKWNPTVSRRYTSRFIVIGMLCRTVIIIDGLFMPATDPPTKLG
ncbi:hypothetical protein SZ00_06189 (plasmid) [Rhodococcus sp. AD45]|nr:hypothetical protein SZ00_06189 [Rhodococcus sp. AD45]